MGQNYFNSLPLRLQLQQLGKCRFMHQSEFYLPLSYSSRPVSGAIPRLSPGLSHPT